MNTIKLPKQAFEHVMSIEDKQEREWAAEAYEILIETYEYPQCNIGGFVSAFILGYISAKQSLKPPNTMQNIKVGDRVRVKATGYETKIIAIDNNFKSHPYCIRENKEIVWYEADQLEPFQ